MDILLLNSFLYLILFIVVCRRKSYVCIFLVSMYLTTSLISIYTFGSGLYEEQQSWLQDTNLKLIPFVYFFVCFLILLFPLFKIKIRPITGNTQSVFLFFNYFNRFYIAISLITFVLCISTFEDSLSLYATGGEDTTLLETMEDRGNGVSMLTSTQGRFFRIYVLFRPIAVISLFYFIAFYKKYRLTITLLLFSCIVPLSMRAVINISRGSLFFVIIDIFCGYIIFYNFIASKIRKAINSSFASIAFVFFFVSLLISYSRFGQTGHSAAYDSILSYFGEPFLNYNLIFWGRVKHFMNGEFNFPEIMHFIDSNVYLPTSKFDAFWYYRVHSGVPVSPFRMIIGGLYIDFGLYTIVFCMLFSLLFWLILRHGVNSISTYLLCYFYIYIIAHGVFTLDMTFELIWSTLFFCCIFYVLNKFFINQKDTVHRS